MKNNTWEVVGFPNDEVFTKMDTITNSMHIIEKWGTGIPRIFKEAKEYGLREPELKDFGTSFRINIFRKEASTDAYGVVSPEAQHEAESPSSASNDAQHATDATDKSPNATSSATDMAAEKAITFSRNELLLLRYIKDHPAAKQREVADATGITIGTVKRLFPLLQKKNALQRNGNHKRGSWEVLINLPDLGCV